MILATNVASRVQPMSCRHNLQRSTSANRSKWPNRCFNERFFPTARALLRVKPVMTSESAIAVIGIIAAALGLGCVIIALVKNWRRRVNVRLYTLD